MGKKDKSSSGGLGRALVRHRNQMVQQSKEKGVALRDLQRRQKPVLESITEVSDIDAILEVVAAAGEAVHSDLHGNGQLAGVPINLDTSSKAGDMLVMTAEERRRQQKEEETLHAGSLRVPRHHGLRKCLLKNLMLMRGRLSWHGGGALRD